MQLVARLPHKHTHEKHFKIPNPMRHWATSNKKALDFNEQMNEFFSSLPFSLQIVKILNTC